MYRSWAGRMPPFQCALHPMSANDTDRKIFHMHLGPGGPPNNLYDWPKINGFACGSLHPELNAAISTGDGGRLSWNFMNFPYASG